MSIIQMKTPAEKVAAYLKHHGYNPLRMDIYGLTAEGYWEFAVTPGGAWETSFNPVRQEYERIRTWRTWKDPEHGKYVERILK